MNRIDQLFRARPNSVLSVYFTAGYPELSDTNLIIEGLEKGGADLIEIGFPFSDPVADGPVIQASSHQALQNGMNLDILFSQLKMIRESSQIPKIMMGYFNTVYQYGVEKFIDRCVECGVDGVILPDLPPEEYEKDYRELFEAAGIHVIFLVAPQTTPERAKYLASLSRGFIYLLSSSSITGSMGQQLGKVPERIFSSGDQEGSGSIPTLIGFGVHDHETFETACQQANGAIIGSGFIRHLNATIGNNKSITRANQIAESCISFIRQIRH